MACIRLRELGVPQQFRSVRLHRETRYRPSTTKTNTICNFSGFYPLGTNLTENGRAVLVAQVPVLECF